MMNEIDRERSRRLHEVWKKMYENAKGYADYEIDTNWMTDEEYGDLQGDVGAQLAYEDMINRGH
jgi:hypothetical protein